MEEKNIIYIAGIFDVRGFVNFRMKSYHYFIQFNFYEKEKNLWEKIIDILSKYFDIKVYQSKKRPKEYQIYIGKKHSVAYFLKTILPYSNRKKEIMAYLKFLEKGRYKKWLS